MLKLAAAVTLTSWAAIAPHTAAQIQAQFCPPEYEEFIAEAHSEFVTINICANPSTYALVMALARVDDGEYIGSYPAAVDDTWETFFAIADGLPTIITETSTQFVSGDRISSYPNHYYYKRFD